MKTTISAFAVVMAALVLGIGGGGGGDCGGDDSPWDVMPLEISVAG